MPTGSGSESPFYADTDSDPDSTISLKHVGKSKDFLTLIIAVTVYPDF
jgi:hypothetical protein